MSVLGLLGLIGVLLLGGCVHSDKVLSSDPELLWKTANEAYESGDYESARIRFDKFRRFFPQDRRVALARLRTADSCFQNEKYFEAEVHYEHFLELHPTHVEMPNAIFQLGLSQKNQIPSNTDRDVSKAKQALKTFTHYLNLPQSDQHLRQLAQTHYEEIERLLLEKEYDISSWYFKTDRYQSAFGRFTDLIDTYGHLYDVEEERLFESGLKLVRCVSQLQDRKKLGRARLSLQAMARHSRYSKIMEELAAVDTSGWE